MFVHLQTYENCVHDTFDDAELLTFKIMKMKTTSHTILSMLDQFNYNSDVIWYLHVVWKLSILFKQICVD